MMPNLVRFDDGRLLTRNLAPGQRVYDEELHTVQGAEHRTWNPMKSKLGSYLVKGGRNLELRADSVVLYLGAANGTTPSHVSDIVSDGLMVAVEFSPRSFRDLLRMSDPRPNIVPVLGDAWRPELYERYLGKVDLVFQDIAQRQQGAIFAKNVNRFKPKTAILAVKARSVDVAANPRDVYANVSEEVGALTGYDPIEMVDLGPYEKDHAALVFVPGTGGKRPVPQREQRAERRDERPRRDDRHGGGQRDERPRFGPKGGGAPPPRDGPKKWDKRPYDKQDRPAGFNRDRPGYGDRPPRGPPPGERRDDRPKWR